MEYPTKKDIEKHTNQFVGVLRQYFRGVSRLDFVKNDLRCLFTDLFLEAHNEGGNLDVTINFDKFLKELVK